MANNVMKAKAHKLRNQRRRYPRRMDLDKRGPRPNVEVIRAYKERAQGIGEKEPDDFFMKLVYGHAAFKNTPTGKHDIELRKEEILHKFDAPCFVEHFSTPVQRVRIYFNSRQDKVVIQQMHYHQRIFRLSEVFTNIDDAYFVLNNNIVTWKIEKPFPSCPSGDSPA